MKPIRPMRRSLITALMTLSLAGCGGSADELSLGMALSFPTDAAVPPETIAAFEVGVVQGLANNNCGPYLSAPLAGDATPTCPSTLSGTQLLELRDADGRAVKKRRIAPALSGSGLQQLSVEVPVGPSTSVLIQAVDAAGGLLGSTCAYVGRVTISSVEFNNRTLELHLDDRYTTCQPVIP
ncbi:MAG TPA: hypothetical protein VK013_18310 [Myxococcaceae bacterium]|nr:hypothetical protein [Myxococcaceae bacterium]